jgi:hypothetical protein
MALREQPAAGESGFSSMGKPFKTRRKERAVSSTTQRTTRRSYDGEEGDTLLRRDLREGETEGREKPHAWQPARLKFVFLVLAIVDLNRNELRSQ